ncbi:MAG: GNAT family N-acetyltransferase [Candidatus Latescibacterota bacterium]
MLTIREEHPEDIPAIRLVNERAFGQPMEADLVDALRAGCDEFLSLVAVLDDRVVGHILFTPATIESNNGIVRGMGLAPAAVLPEFQKQGIGSHLIQEGLRMLRARSCPFVIVLGHPEYYPRFGFEPASKFGLRSQWEGVPDEAFMALILDEAVMEGVTGVARYRDEFDAAME